MNGRFWNKKEKVIAKDIGPKRHCKIGPKIESWGTPDVIVSNSLCLLFI